jgi:hypothetical protein
MLVAAAPAMGTPHDGAQSLTAPLGSTEGSFIDGSMVYGSDG